MGIVTKKYNRLYKNQILELFKKTFQKELSSDFWNWRFEKNPFGKPLIRLAFYKKKLVAQYLLQPINLELNSDKIRALFSMTTMTDPEFARRGIMLNLALQVYNIGKKNNYKFVFGFANKTSRHMFVNKLGWKELAIMEELSINVKKQLSSKYICSKISHFDKSYTKFYKSMTKKISKIIIPRTSEYLNWRFTSHPDKPYYCYKITKNGEFVGYFVLKNYQGIKCHIIDFLLLDDLECFNTMINQAFSFCKDNNVTKLTLWVNKTLSLYTYLRKMGFCENKMETYFIVKPLSYNSNVENFDKWYITMSDSDVF